MLDESIQELASRSLARIAAAPSAEALEAVRVDAVGRKGALAEISKGMGKLSPEERKIYDLICRRLLSAWHDDHIWSVTTVITAIRNDATVDRYHTSGSAVVQVGWKVLDLAPAKPRKATPATDDGRDEQALPPGLSKGQPQDVLDAEVLKKKTRAPKRLTEGTLLTAMETAGRTLDEKELSDAMKETGLGTPATRAAIIETLLKRVFVAREGKHLVPTPMGIGLIDALPVQNLASPELTGNWEARLSRMARGQEQRAVFMADIATYVKEVVDAIRGAAPMAEVPLAVQTPPAGKGARRPSRAPRKPKAPQNAAAVAKPASKTSAPRTGGQGIGDLVCPVCKQGPIIVGKRGWGCSRWREGCKFVVWFEADGKQRGESDLRAIVNDG